MVFDLVKLGPLVTDSLWEEGRTGLHSSSSAETTTWRPLPLLPVFFALVQDGEVIKSCEPSSGGVSSLSAGDTTGGREVEALGGVLDGHCQDACDSKCEGTGAEGRGG